MGEKSGSHGMRVVCAWCSKDMGEKDGEGVRGVSHGLCRECFDKVMPGEENGIMMGLAVTEDTEERKANVNKPGRKVDNFRANYFSIEGEQDG